MRKELVKIVVALGFLIAASVAVYANGDKGAASQNDYHISLMNLEDENILITLKSRVNCEYELVIRDENGEIVFKETNENNTFQFKGDKGFYHVYVKVNGEELEEGVISI